MEAKKPEFKYSPSKEYKYFVWNSEQEEFRFFPTQESADEYFEEVLFEFRNNSDTWDAISFESTKGIVQACIEHEVVATRPENIPIDEDHPEWPEGLEDKARFEVVDLT